MINILFTKQEKGIYVPHVDTLRILNRVFRRAGIEVAYSQGFNKRMLINLTQPLPFGIASTQDWASVDVVKEIDCEEFLQLFNQHCPPFLQAVYCRYTQKYPNLSANVNCCRYIINCENVLEKEQCIQEVSRSLIIDYTKKNQLLSKDFSDCVYKLDVHKDHIDCVLAFGNKNLRVDLFCNHLNKMCGLDITNEDITRTEQLIFDGKDFVSSVEYVESML